MKETAVSVRRQRYLTALHRHRRRIRFWQISLLVGFFLFWEISCRVGLSDGFLTSSPTRMVLSFLNLCRGGEVLLPAGTYLSGSIFLKSRVDFHLAQGAVLKGSPDPADYNAVDVAPQNAASPLKGDNTSGAHLVLCIDSCLVVKENKT